MASKKDQATAATPPPTEAKKSSCPITREQFRTKAPAAITVTVNGIPLAATRKEFETGSLGYNSNDKISIEIDGVPVKFQVGLNLTAVGSKELPK